MNDPRGRSAAPRRDLGDLRPAPARMPDPGLRPPVVAESRDPFATLRIVDLVARLPRGEPLSLAAVVDRLNALHLEWLFTERVVADALLQLQANWAADYRSTGGILVEDGPQGASVSVEDSPRVDPWIVGQARRTADECRVVLDDFSRRDRPTGLD
ncbi:MAG: hypothetical protein ABIV26_09295 [Candidatus Limnocylindrales bacterium]